jgi:hypothetical protein
MINPQQVPPVDDSELLARYVMQSGHFRQDRTLKQDLFVPHPHQEVSVTRHRDATLSELWAVGENVAKKRGKTLYGRADIRAIDCKVDTLKVIEKPLAENPNHADVEGFPLEKADQKAIALKLAAAAGKIIFQTYES